jgi:hypothetical protein
MPNKKALEAINLAREWARELKVLEPYGFELAHIAKGLRKALGDAAKAIREEAKNDV